MDRKAIIVLVLSFLLLVAWVPLVNWLYPPKPLPSGAKPGLTNKAETIVTNVSPTAATLVNPPTNTIARPPLAPKETERLVELTADGSTYVFTSHGGGLKQVILSADKYPETTKRGRAKGANGPGVLLNRGALKPVLALGGHPLLEDDRAYHLSKTGQVVRAEKELAGGLRIVKEFRPSSNYLMEATVRLENVGATDLMVPTQEWTAGTASLVHSKEDPMQLGFFVHDGHSGKPVHINEAWFANRTLGCFPGTPRQRFETAGNPAVWVAVHNRFFTLAVAPKDPAAAVIGEKVDLNLEEKDPTRRAGLQTALIYKGQALEAAAGRNTIERHFVIYAGPKDYGELARLGEQMKNNLDYVMDFSGFFGFFSKILLLSMKGLHDSFKLPYGWAIIIITIIIKLLFWPLTQASTKSMKRMAALQPEMKKIQERYKDDPQKMNRKLMEFMKENKVSPLGGCLPMVIQIPVFFGFYFMIQSAIELRGASFLWAWDLSVPDTIATVFGFPINPLPIVMGVTMFWQSSLTPPSPGMDPTQQKIMKYMPLIFLFVLYNMSSGLTLYWTVQNILTIVQTKLTKTDAAKKPGTPAGPALIKKK